MALCLDQMGRRGEAQRALERLVAQRAYDDAYQIAQVYAWRGDGDHAMEWLERSLRQHDGGLTWLTHDPFMAPLRGDPRFRAFLQRLKLPLP
jgi:hypothetical protein